MKHREATVSAGKTAISRARSGIIVGVISIAGLLPLPLDAAVDSDGSGSSGITVAIDSRFPAIAAYDDEDVLPGLGDQNQVVAQQFKSHLQPADSRSRDAVNDVDETLWPSKELGIMDRVQDWLARANREFQFTIIRRLSTAPAGGGADDIARKLEQVTEEDAKGAADREAIKASQVKQVAEERHREELARAAREASERARIEAETQSIETQRKTAEAKRMAEEQKRSEEARLAKALQAEQRAAVEKKAAEDAAAKDAAKEAAAAANKELAARQAAEERRQRELADAAQKASEDASRVAAAQADTLKAAAAKDAEAKAKAAEALAAENAKAAPAAAAKDADAKAADAKKATKESEQKQAMVEDEDKSSGDTGTAEAAPEVAPSEHFPDADEPDSKTDPQPKADDAKKAAVPVRRHPAHASRQASDNLARGPVVARWIRRARQGRCRLAGRKILLPGRYTVARGDTLSLISLRHYRSSRYYLRIYRTNRDIISNPNRIYPCQRLYLPRRRG